MAANVRYRWTLLRAGPLMLDGGSMFGVVPRVVWTRSITPDDRNRITLAHNCLLLEPADPPATPDAPRRILIETGTGDKLDPKMRDIFGLEDRTVETAIREAGIEPAQVDAVIVSHLHFDHAGGLTRRCREGETPDWTAPQGAAPLAHNAVKLTFPSARVFVQRREWDDAIANTSVMTRTYYRDHLDPLLLPLPGGRPRLELIDSPQPYPPSGPDPRPPGRDQRPPAPLADRTTEALPGIDVFLVPGHTWGQQAVRFTDDRGRVIVFTPDVLPSSHHVGAAYSLAYDVEPYTSMLTKRWFLEEAAAGDWRLLLDHEPGQPLRRVRPAGNWFELPPEDAAAD